MAERVDPGEVKRQDRRATRTDDPSVKASSWAVDRSMADPFASRHRRSPASRSRWPVSSVLSVPTSAALSGRVCVWFCGPWSRRSQSVPPSRHALNFVHICFPDRSDSHFVLIFFLQVALLYNGGSFMRFPISGIGFRLSLSPARSAPPSLSSCSAN